MKTAQTKQGHVHGPECGHVAIMHNGHVDYLLDGRLEHVEGERVEQHVLEVTATNPDTCTHGCGGHETTHVHGPNCGHPKIPHGDHIDYLVDGRLHHPHGDHCDDHGPVKVKS